MKKKKHWYDYLLIWSIIYFALGFFNILDVYKRQVYEYDGHEGLNLLMLDDAIPAGAKLY